MPPWARPVDSERDTEPVGDLLLARHNGATVAWTPYTMRQGDGVVSFVELLAIQDDTDLQIELYHKNRDETGDGVALANSVTLTSSTSPPVQMFANEGLKELVRYRVTLSYTGSTFGTIVHAMFRILDPSWQR